MGSELLLAVVKSLVATILSVLSPEQAKALIDKAFDMVEEKVAASPNKWDDAVALPMLQALRTILNVPDNDSV